ncbi:MAG: beta-xylosidase, partial [Kribbellaceae bacterium]|nr:beta-xylosidase [Kribbellaceae bacterium]
MNESSLSKHFENQAWRDVALPVEKRAELLLQAMTLAEKVAQLGSRWVGNDMADSDTAGTEKPVEEQLNVAPLQDVFAAGGSVSLEDASRDGLGHLTRVWGSVPLSVEEGKAEVIRQHRVVLEGSRLGVPALVHEECLTGFTTYGATVYPTALAWGAT